MIIPLLAAAALGTLSLAEAVAALTALVGLAHLSLESAEIAQRIHQNRKTP